MLSSYQLKTMKFFLFFILLLIFQRPIRAEDQIVTICPAETSNFTSGSQFETNLNILLSDLSTNGLLNRESFYNTSYGDDPDKIYGFSQCMSAASEDTCRRCLVDGISEITKICPKKKEASVRFYNCIMRYSYQPFFSQPNTGLIVTIRAPASSSNLTIFNQILGGLLNNLSNDASSQLSKYAQNVANYADFEKIYGMAQCTRDLSQLDCNSCLQQRIGYIPDCCGATKASSVYTMSCNVRYDTTPFFTLSSSPPPPQPPPPSDASSPTNTSDPTIAPKGSGTPVVAIVIPIVIAVMLLSLAIICFIRRKSKKTSQGRRSDALIGEQEDISKVESLQFDLHTIEIATDNFSDNNKLGEGGFGVVYKGKLVDGEEVAVKRLSRASGQGATEFKNEVMLVAKLQHKNLVRLLGFCLDGVEKILIYEYVVNKSLDNYLFDPIKRLLLSWEKRYKIIIGIARGLLYLHEDSRLRIIHRDLKASNILLDSNMNSKIADFGTARLFGVDQTRGNTSIIAGTFGYMAPEYGMYGQFSVKSDVYSFGVLLLEIVSGQKNSSSYESDNDSNLLNLAWRKWTEGTASELMDPIMGESYSRSEVMRCIRIGLLCVQEDLNARPTMSSVVLMLSSSSITLQSPLPPAFFISSRMQSNGNSSTLSSRVSEPDKSERDITPLSINEASITDPYPR